MVLEVLELSNSISNAKIILQICSFSSPSDFSTIESNEVSTVAGHFSVFKPMSCRFSE